MKRTPAIVAAASVTVLLAACSTGSSSTTTGSSSGGGSKSASSSSPAPLGSSLIDVPITKTSGPNGETPTPLSALKFTPAQIAKLKAGHYTAAQLWHTSSEFVSAVQNGANAEFARFGIKDVANSNANLDAGTQANQVQTVMAKKPSVIIGLPVDPTSAAAAFQPAVNAGTKLVFLSNVPTGYTYNKQYSSIVTDDLFSMGKKAADALGTSLGGKGTIAVMYYATKYYVTNQRDAAFVATIKKDFPNIKIVAEQGFTDPTNATGIASALLTKHPKLDGIYTSWSQPAEGVLAALRTVSNTHVKVVTLDIDDTVMVDMATGGATVAVVVDRAYALGKGMADAAAYALLGEKAPPFLVASALTITKNNIPQGYKESLNTAVPAVVQKVLK